MGKFTYDESMMVNEKIARISCLCEVMWIRMLVAADEQGRVTGDIDKLKNVLFPMRRDYDIAIPAAIQQLEAVGAIKLDGDWIIPVRFKQKKSSQGMYSDKAMKIVELFNLVCTSLPHSMLTSARNSSILARMKEGFGYDAFEEIFSFVQNDPFYSGRDGKWKGCCLDWILRPNNFVKILERSRATRILYKGADSGSILSALDGDTE